MKTVSEIFEDEFHFITFDLKSGYHHVPIREEHRKYLGFSWTFADGTTRYFQFLVLPFGLASACYAFTKLMRPLVKKWRGQGIRCVVYLDDGIAGDASYTQCKNISDLIQSDLRNAGLTINAKKSKLEPSQNGNWLGFDINTRLMIFSVPRRKIEKIQGLITSVYIKKSANAKEIARICGHLISCSIAIGPLTRLFTRRLYAFVDRQQTWYRGEILDEGALEELWFWQTNLEQNNGFQVKQKSLMSKIVFSDASATGHGSFIAKRLDNIICRGTFAPDEVVTSSTYRELYSCKICTAIFWLLIEK